MVDCHVGAVDVHEGLQSAWRQDVMGAQVVGLFFVCHGGNRCVFHEGTLFVGRDCCC